jgi:hypothetical protein
MGRPTDWTPLGCDGDPVPGDPAQISQEAAHLGTVARQISDQVAALRKIAGGGVEVGKHADKIRSSSSDLADQLDKVVGRYQKVSAALTQWVPDLQQAQAQSITALNEAEVPYKKLPPTVALPSGSHLTAQQKQDVTNYHNSMNQAQQQLDDAKALLAKAVSFRNDRASHYAGVINSAIDDGVKDSWWDQFKDFVSQYAWLIKDICTALEVVATILAVVALFIPGVNIIAALLWIGFGLTAAALLGRVMLAATGNGSWFDVAMDAFALLTFGVGKFAASGLEAVSEGTETLGKGLVAGQRAAMTAKSEAFLARSADLFDDQSLTKIAVQQMENITKLAPDVGEFQGKLPLAVRFALKIGGTSEDVEHAAKVLAVTQRFGDNPAVAANAAVARNMVTVLGVNAGVTFAAGIGVPAVGGLELDGSSGQPLHIGSVPLSVHIPDNPVTNVYNRIEDKTTFDGGLSTAQADGLVHAASVINPASIPSFELATGTW